MLVLGNRHWERQASGSARPLGAGKSLAGCQPYTCNLFSEAMRERLKSMTETRKQHESDLSSVVQKLEKLAPQICAPGLVFSLHDGSIHVAQITPQRTHTYTAF